MRCELERKLLVRSSCGHSSTIHTTLCTAHFPGVPAHSNLSQPQSFQLAGFNLYPTTHGYFLSVDYCINICCDIAYCPDVELRLPFTLGAPMIMNVVPAAMQSAQYPTPGNPAVQPEGASAPPTGSLDGQYRIARH
jgi:hypothetical protein